MGICRSDGFSAQSFGLRFGHAICSRPRPGWLAVRFRGIEPIPLVCCIVTDGSLLSAIVAGLVIDEVRNSLYRRIS